MKSSEVWYIASVTDSRFPNDVKLPGGTSKNASWEEPPQTLCRELGEEISLYATPGNCCTEVHKVEKGRGHTQYFYLVMNWTGRIREGAFADTDGVTMTAQWTPLIEFKRRCYRGHYDGFVAAVTRFANTVDDSSFFDQARTAGIM